MTTDIHFLLNDPAQLDTSPKVNRHYARKEKALMMGKVVRMVLFFYILAMFQPVVPIILDMIAHTFYAQQHIMQVHEVHGQFHIHNELGKALHQQDKEKSGDLTYELPQYVHVEVYTFKVMQDAVCCCMYLTYSRYHAVSAQDIDAPPPRFA